MNDAELTQRIERWRDEIGDDAAETCLAVARNEQYGYGRSESQSLDSIADLDPTAYSELCRRWNDHAPVVGADSRA